jgi:uncharacterized membrane protein HdeD (DUF308 family)
MNTTVYENVTGIGQFVYAVNYESSGFLLTSIIFVVFAIILISLITRSNSNIFEIISISGLLTFIPSTILATQTFLAVSVIGVWVPIFFIFVIAIGVGGMYFSSK